MLIHANPLPGEPLAYSFGDGLSLPPIRPRRYDYELVAAVSSNDLSSLAQVGDDSGDKLYDVVPGREPVCGVEELQVVYVGQDYGHRPAILSRSLYRLC
jgi:hypothetical protein